MTREAVIVGAARTPIGKAVRGSLAQVRAEDLAESAVSAALAQAPGLEPEHLDDLLIGAWLHGGDQGSNLARRLGVLLGWDHVPGATVNRACASSLQTLRMATHAIRAEEGRAFIAAGVESVSGYADRRAAGTTSEEDKHPAFRQRQSLPPSQWSDPRDQGHIPDVHMAMGITAENVARLRGVSRADQDAYAFRSQTLTRRSIERGFFDREISPQTTAQGITVSRDDSPRPGTTPEELAQLPPAFADDGTVTAGNCCPLNDGAAALVVADAEWAADLGLTPLARVVSTGVSALSPEIMGLGPVAATRQALRRAGMSVADLDLIELNEAFAAQVLPCIDDLGLDIDRVNVNGGAIALGHPFGMGGARLTTTLINGMRERDAQVGLVTMCAAGGQGMSVIIERVS